LIKSFGVVPVGDGRVLAMNRLSGVAGRSAIAVMVVTLLAGCAGSIAERSYEGLPSDSAPSEMATPGQAELPDPDLGPRVQWSDGGRLLSVSLFGSSSCPQQPTKLTRVAHDYLKVVVEQTGGDQCTADLRAMTYELVVPETVSATSPVTVKFAEHEFTLPPRGTL
jgi:hypothetical protein